MYCNPFRPLDSVMFICNMGNNVALTREDDVLYKAKFDTSPFAFGASRAAYKGRLVAPTNKSGVQVVVKKFKREFAHNKDDWNVDLEVSQKADELAQQFNNITGTSRPIHFSQPLPMMITDTPYFGSTTCREGEWVTAECFIPGRYTKWSSNAGWVNNEEMGGGGSLPAFSHWTWVQTDGQLIVCDLQGVRDITPSIVGYWLTDPAINSRSKRYGNTDLGHLGITLFFRSHRCTQFCRDLGLVGKVPPMQTDPLSIFLAALFSSQRSTSYSGQVQRIVHVVVNMADHIIVEEGSDEDEEGSDDGRRPPEVLDASDEDKEGSGENKKGTDGGRETVQEVDTDDEDEEGSDRDEEGSNGDEKGSDRDEEGSNGDEEDSDGDEEGSDGDEEGSDGGEEGSNGDEEDSDGGEEPQEIESDTSNEDREFEGSGEDKEGSDEGKRGSDEGSHCDDHIKETTV